MYVVIGFLIFVFFAMLFIYNSLVSYRNMADSAASTIEVMLKKRWDLIPNLVAATKGYMEHESTVLAKIASMRSTALSMPLQSSERIESEQQLSSALSPFRIAVESYPDLKASDSFMKLQGALNECEEQISAARRAFNAAVLQYNNSVEMFPHSVIATWFDFKRKAFFEIADSDREVPSVK